MIPRALRPKSVTNIGDKFYPEGEPVDPDDEVYNVKCVDEHGELFSIVYTRSQFDKHVERNGGIFSPFLPVYLTTSTI